ncbi:hypothetical protein QJS66_15105 [Kocuria rhizophila]|nr:hypothetical protein QJS66_15105 [Kocuria rhizophila]
MTSRDAAEKASGSAKEKLATPRTTAICSRRRCGQGIRWRQAVRRNIGTSKTSRTG